MSNKKGASFNGDTNAISLNGLLEGSILDRTAKFANSSNVKIRNAQIRMAQPKPTSGIKCISMMGKMTPPSDDPAVVRPRAAPRFLKNQVETQVKAG